MFLSGFCSGVKFIVVKEVVMVGGGRFSGFVGG